MRSVFPSSVSISQRQRGWLEGWGPLDKSDKSRTVRPWFVVRRELVEKTGHEAVHEGSEGGEAGTDYGDVDFKGAKG